MGMVRWWAAMGLMACMAGAHAGDIYTCKGANGVNTYQNTPCPSAQAELRHSQYSESMARAPAPTVGGVDDVSTGQVAAAPVQRFAPAPVQARTPQAPPAGYQCTAGRRTWIQFTPCPSTYAAANPVTVDGFTDSGQHVMGNGWVDQQAPVKEQVMDRDSLCDRVRAGANMGGNSESSRSYERNKIKRNVCGG